MRLIYFGVSAGVTGDPVEGDCEENEGFFLESIDIEVKHSSWSFC